MVFYACSYTASIYLAYVLPFNTFSQNTIEICNEVIISILGIGAMCLIGLATSVEDRHTQGWYLCIMIYTKLIFNSVIILYTLVRFIFRSQRRAYQRRKMKKRIKVIKPRESTKVNLGLRIRERRFVFMQEEQDGQISKE